MPKNFNDISKAVQNGVDSNYRMAVRERKDIYNDNWEHIIKNELLNQFNTDNFDSLKCMITGEMNVVKRTINTISTIYKENAERKLIVSETDEGEIETDEVYDDIIGRIPFDLIMRKANQMTNLTNSCVIRTVYRDGKLDYDVMTFDSVSILTDPRDWKKIIGYRVFLGASLPYSGGEGDETGYVPQGYHDSVDGAYTKYERCILYTSDSDFFPDDMRGKIIEYDQAKGGDSIICTDGEGRQKIDDSPYKNKDGETILPFTLILKDYPVDSLIDYTSGNDIIYLGINTAVNYVHLNALYKYASWKQGYIISDTELPDNFNLSPENWVKVPTAKNGGTTSVGVLDIQAKIMEQWNVIVDRIKIGLAQYGIDAESFTRSGGGTESGYALSIRKEGLAEIRKGQLPIYTDAETHLFETSRTVYNYHNPTKMISEEGRFNVDFGDISATENQTERDTHWSNMINQDIKSRLDWIKDENPDIKTDEDAEAVLKSNRHINNRLASVLSPVNQPDIDNEPQEVL